jgi:hypothetical protein
VEFVNNGIMGMIRPPIIAPIKWNFPRGDHSKRSLSGIGAGAACGVPGELCGERNGPGAGIEKNFLPVETVAHARVGWTLHAIGVVPCTGNLGKGDSTMPYARRLVLQVIERILIIGQYALRVGVEEQGYTRSMLGVEGEVKALFLCDPGCPEGEWRAFSFSPIIQRFLFDSHSIEQAHSERVPRTAFIVSHPRKCLFLHRVKYPGACHVAVIPAKLILDPDPGAGIPDKPCVLSGMTTEGYPAACGGVVYRFILLMNVERSNEVSAVFSQGEYGIDQIRKGMAQHEIRRFIGKVIWEVEKGAEPARRGNFEKIV